VFVHISKVKQQSTLHYSPFNYGTVNKLVEGEEGKMTKPCQDPALNDLNPYLHFCLVPRLADPSRDDGKSVMGGYLLVGGVEIGFITGGLGDPALEIIGNDQIRDPFKEGKGPYVGLDPVRQ
jgi:hypothetical protein